MKMQRCLILFFVAAALATAQTKKSEAALGAARHLEEAEGNYPKAIEAYKKIVAQAGKDRALAAKALVRMGQAYEKLGDAEARRAYERVVREFADQKEAVAEAKARLGGGAAEGGKILARQLPSYGNAWNGDWPNPSADGKLLYLVSGDYCDGGIMDLSTGVTRALGWGRAPCMEATGSVVPSPDGRMLAYDWCGPKSDREIRIADAEGRNPRTVYKGAGYVVAWTADQQGIFVRRGGLGMLDLKTGTYRQIVDGGGGGRDRFIPSPDSRWVAYPVRVGSFPENRDVYAVPSSGGAPVLVAGGLDDEFPLAWTVDGNGLLISSNRGGQPAIWGIAIEDGKPRGEPKLIYPSAPATQPLGMTRSGTLLMAASKSQRTIFEVFIDEATGKAQPPRRMDVKGGNPPKYLSDGKTAVYILDGRLIVRELGTDRERTVEATCGRVGMFYGIHPNGKLLLAGCSSREGGVLKEGYYLVNVETGAAQLLMSTTDRKTFPASPVLSGDGGRLYFTRSQPQSRSHSSLEIATLQEREEWRARARFYLFSFSPDDRHMAVRWEEGPNLRVQIVGRDGAAVAELPKEATAVTWSGDGKWIFFEEAGTPDKIKRMPASGGEAETVYEGSVFWQGLSVHPSGSRISVVETNFNMETWALDNIGNVSLR